MCVCVCVCAVGVTEFAKKKMPNMPPVLCCACCLACFTQLSLASVDMIYTCMCL